MYFCVHSNVELLCSKCQLLLTVLSEVEAQKEGWVNRTNLRLATMKVQPKQQRCSWDTYVLISLSTFSSKNCCTL